MKTTFESASILDFPKAIRDDARVWIYQAERPLSDDEISQIQSACDEFVADWQTHGSDLAGFNQVYFDRFIVFFVNPGPANASGCSIDSSIHFIQTLEKQYRISLTGRTNVAIMDGNGQVYSMPLSEMPRAYREGEVTDDTLVFNNLVANKKEMEEGWILPLGESWHKRMI